MHSHGLETPVGSRASVGLGQLLPMDSSHARRPDSRRPLRPRGHRPVARRGAPLFRPVRVVGGTTAVLALGSSTDEPLSSEDIALLGAVAADRDRPRECRLYRQLHLRPWTGPPGPSTRTSWSLWTTAFWSPTWTIASCLEQRARARVRRDAAGRHGAPAGRPVRRAVPRGGARHAPRVAGGSSVEDSRHGPIRATDAARLVTWRGAPARLGRRRRGHGGHSVHPQDVTSRVQLEEQLQISRRWRRSASWRPVSRTRSTRLTGFQLHSDAAAGADPRIRERGCGEDRAPDVPRRQDRQRAAKPLQAGPTASSDRAVIDVNAVLADVLGRWSISSPRTASRCERS